MCAGRGSSGVEFQVHVASRINEQTKQNGRQPFPNYGYGNRRHWTAGGKNQIKHFYAPLPSNNRTPDKKVFYLNDRYKQTETGELFMIFENPPAICLPPLRCGSQDGGPSHINYGVGRRTSIIYLENVYSRATILCKCKLPSEIY